MAIGIENFSRSARDLSRSPLGLIALFLVLAYAFACLVVGASGISKLPQEDLPPLVWFLVTYPFAVLVMSCWLVSQRHTNLYHPAEIPKEIRKDWIALGVETQTPPALLAGRRKKPPARTRLETPPPERAGLPKQPKGLKKKKLKADVPAETQKEVEQ